MNRRHALLALSGALTTTLIAAAPRGAFAQPATISPSATPLSPSEYRKMTLAAGSFALQSSQLATQRAQNPRVREFAQFELAEQISMAQVLLNTNDANPPPAPLDPTHAALLKTLADTQGSGFDMAYLQAQTQGHQELLAIQQNFLRAPVQDRDLEHIAVLARATITMHITMLQDLTAALHA